MGRDGGNNLIPHGFAVSIHAPRVGRDSSCWRARSIRRCFNPRAPRGARHKRAGQKPPAPRVSIHAPRVGRDSDHGTREAAADGFNPRAPRGARRVAYSHAPSRTGFNPRAPRGARHHRKQVKYAAVMFQSTRPAWGATALAGSEREFAAVSIHAPRVGRDTGSPIMSTNPLGFNPRAPRGARRELL